MTVHYSDKRAEGIDLIGRFVAVAPVLQACIEEVVLCLQTHAYRHVREIHSHPLAPVVSINQHLKIRHLKCAVDVSLQMLHSLRMPACNSGKVHSDQYIR